ncbi:MAG: adenylate/guanylate cyclase domain-containing protein [Desulfobacteraceae bacterium]|nr:adenylate/guanylate cyclase domain-containing protein [Desulfobacteraceae bacterium]
MLQRIPFAFIICLITGSLGLIIGYLPVAIDLEERVGLDMLFKIRGPKAPPPDVLLLSLDQLSADGLNLPSQLIRWPRSVHARLVDRLSNAGAAVIVYDVIFENPGPKGLDESFAAAIAGAGNVVIGEFLEKEIFPTTAGAGSDLIVERIVPPLAVLSDAAAATAPFPLPKLPVKVSQYWTFKQAPDPIPTLPVAGFQLYALQAWPQFYTLLQQCVTDVPAEVNADPERMLRDQGIKQAIVAVREVFRSDPALGSKMRKQLTTAGNRGASPAQVALIESLIRMYEGADTRFLNLYGPPGTIGTIPINRILTAEADTADEPDIDVAGRAVFIGLTESYRLDQKDGFFTAFSHSNGIDISGVELAATAFANLVENRPVQPLSVSLHNTLLFLFGVAATGLCIILPVSTAVLVMIGLGGGYAAFAIHLFNTGLHWLPLTVPLFFQLPLAFFIVLLWKFFDSRRESRQIREAFELYLPRQVVDELTENAKAARSDSRIVYGTCLFTDAEGYTSISEKMDPLVLTGYMNSYYARIFEPVRQQGGNVSDVKGDSMLAVWASVKPDPQQLDKAVKAAWTIHTDINRTRRASDGFSLPTRIGLHSGYISMGNIGAMDHYEYRPMGDIVNTASRIEQLNKRLGTRILASGDTLEGVGGFVIRCVGKFLLPGKSKPVTLYEIQALTDSAWAGLSELNTEFAFAMSAFENRDWDSAMSGFARAGRIVPDDGPALFYETLCRRFKNKPPRDKWRGEVMVSGK